MVPGPIVEHGSAGALQTHLRDHARAASSRGRHAAGSAPPRLGTLGATAGDEGSPAIDIGPRPADGGGN